MKPYVLTICAISALLLVPVASSGQAGEPGAAAKPVTPSFGRPSTMQLKQNALNQQRAIVQSQLREIRRCIQDASQDVTLRDPQGNINRVPQTDLVNCGRQLEQIQRRIDALARQAAALAQDAQVEANSLQRAAQVAQTLQQRRSVLRRKNLVQ